MTQPIPQNPFEPDDPAGWPVVATLLVRMDPRAEPVGLHEGFDVTLEGVLPRPIVTHLILERLAAMVVMPHFGDGMLFHRCDEEDGGGRHG